MGPLCRARVLAAFGEHISGRMPLHFLYENTMALHEAKELVCTRHDAPNESVVWHISLKCHT